MKQNMLITIITRNAPEKLGKILSSIQNNSSLRNFPVLVVDDSCPEKVAKNGRLITKYGPSGIQHVFKERWVTYRSQILQVINSEFVHSLELGRTSWNTPDVRNISQILAVVLYKDILSILHLDDDMLVDGLHIATEDRFGGLC
jgi:hypothetical protein